MITGSNGVFKLGLGSTIESFPMVLEREKYFGRSKVFEATYLLQDILL
jgi:hypothetical protein